MKFKKSVKCDAGTINEIKHNFNSFKINTLLYLYGNKDESSAYESYKKYVVFFSDVSYKLGIDNGEANFLTNTMSGDPIYQGNNYIELSKELVDNIAENNYRYNFYKECIKLMPPNIDDKTLSELVDKMARYLVISDNLIQGINAGIINVNFIEKRAYL